MRARKTRVTSKSKVLAYRKAHPKATGPEVAKALKLSISTVYTSLAKKTVPKENQYDKLLAFLKLSKEIGIENCKKLLENM